MRIWPETASCSFLRCGPMPRREPDTHEGNQSPVRSVSGRRGARTTSHRDPKAKAERQPGASWRIGIRQSAMPLRRWTGD
jgi:hypothetical protein